MKCPVCAWEHPSILCPRCGFDSSRDYEKYPTFGIVDKTPAVSALRKDWAEKQRSVEPEIPPEEFIDRDFRDAFGDFESLFEPEVVEKPRKKRPWLAIAACVATLAVGIWIGSGQGGGTPASTGQGENVQTGQNVSDSSEWRANVLKGSGPASIYVHGTNVLISSVKTVTFLDTLENAPEDAVDVSAKGDGSVKLWSVPNGSSYDLFYGANGGINGRDACQKMFYGYYNLRTIDFGGNFHTDEAQDMSAMFRGCENLTELDLSCFDTANVQDMSGMFSTCTALTELDLSCFDTANVQDMSGMFSTCTALTELDLSCFDTANVQNMSWMFYDCDSLTELDLSSFNTANVQDMSCMFSTCTALTELDLSSFDTAKVQNMAGMFSGCVALTKLDLSSFDTTNVQEMYDMFGSCPAGADWQHLLH